MAPGPVAGTGFGRAPDLPGQESDPVKFFNNSLRIEGVAPIGEAEATPAKVESAASQRACAGPDCQALSSQYAALLFGPSGPYTEEQKAGSEWQARLTAFLGALSDWKQDTAGTAAQLFQQKCAFYNDLINVVPNGAPRERVLRILLGFLKQNDFQAESRMEWFLPVNSVIARVFLDPLGLPGAIADLARSEDPVIALYANLERLIPRRPDQALTLF